MKKNRLPYGKAGFKVPENYFGDFEVRMMRQVAFEEKQFGDKPFKVPEQYFEQLESRIFEKLEEKPKGKVIPLYNKRAWSYVASVAAVLLVLLSSIVFTESQEMGFDDLDVLAVENYLLETIDPQNPNHNPVESYDFSTSVNPVIDKEALLDYLNDHIEEPALLLNED